MDVLFQLLCNEQTLYDAWQMVRQKNSAGGIDGMTVEEFEKDAGKYLRELAEELKAKAWSPEPYLRVEIRKNDSEKRRLGLLSVRDKIVQQAIRGLIEPCFEEMFLNNSYGYRPGKGHSRAIKRVMQEFRMKKNNWVVRLDIDDYFDTINHNLLFDMVRKLIQDEEIVRLMQLCVGMGVVNKKLQWNEVTRGVPQGAVLSPLLSNLYLHPFDKFVTEKTESYVRYADDFLFLCETKEEAEVLMKQAGNFLKERLMLKLNDPQVCDVKTGTEFLGITVKRNGITLSKKKRDELEGRINSVTWENGVFTGKSLEILEGVRNYYGCLLAPKMRLCLDRMLTERLEELVVKQGGCFCNKKSLEACLGTIIFFADETDRRVVVGALLKAYTNAKAEKRKMGAGTEADRNRKLIGRRKKEYQKKEGEGTDLVVHSFGSFVGVTSRGISVKLKGRVIYKDPARALEHLTIAAKGVTISANAVHYCMRKGIPVDFFDGEGKHFGSVLSPSYMDNSLWENQACLTLGRRGYLAARIIYGKLKNQLNLMKYFHKYHKGIAGALAEKYGEACRRMEELILRVKDFEPRDEKYPEELSAMEAAGAVHYWGYVRLLLADDDVEFEGRERKGATDLVNSLLNYGYAILYVRVWQALLGVGLNPMMGVIHVRQPGKPVFVYDVIELFRAQAVDRVVISLIQKGEPLTMDQTLLSESTRKLLVQNIFERLNRYEKYRGKEMKFNRIFRCQAGEIAGYVEGKKIYRPYIAKW